MATRTHGGEEIDRSVNSVNFTEFTVKRKPSPRVVFIKVLLLMLYCATAGFCWFFAWYLGAIGLLLAVILFWFTWPLTNTEYEYITTSGSLIFTRIDGAGRKKEVFSAKIKDFDIIAPYTDEYKERAVSDKIYDFRESPKQTEDVYFATVTKERKKVTVLFRCTGKALKIFTSYNRENTVKTDNLRY